MATDAALDKQAEDILMLDIHEVSAYADYLSTRHRVRPISSSFISAVAPT
jgi:ribosomal silencing factor RsfS